MREFSVRNEGVKPHNNFTKRDLLVSSIEIYLCHLLLFCEKEVRKMREKLLITLTFILAITTSAPAVAATKNPYGTSVVDPAAPNEIILTITKGKNRVDFAYPRLLKMKSETLRIYEPFIKKNQTFTVIPLKSLFAFVGIGGKDKVVTRALNDYIYTDIASGFISNSAYLAIKVDGAPIGYDQGGPVRIIFPNSSKWASNLDAWNWSLASISVK